MSPQACAATSNSPILAFLDDIGFGTEPLAVDLERLADPGREPDAQLAVHAAAKYFFAFVHPGSALSPVPGGEVRELLELFARHQSLNEPGDDIEVMNRLRHFSGPMAPMADPARAGQVLLAVLGARLPDRDQILPFQGLDLFSGSGWLVLAQSLLARRLDRIHGHGGARVLGLEPDPQAAKRSRELLEKLDVVRDLGEVLAADPAQPETLAVLPGPPDFLSMGPFGWHERRLSGPRFFQALDNLSLATSGRAPSASFPEGLVVYNTEMGVSLILNRDSLFHGPREYAGAEFTVQGLFVQGRLLPLHRLGES